MSESLSLSSKVKLKTNRIHPHSICHLQEGRKSRVFIAQSRGVHVYDPSGDSFERVKLGEEETGVVSCLTVSDDLVFFCCGTRVLACGLNGRTLFETTTYLAVEKVDAIHVHGYQLWLVAGNIVSQFQIGGAQLANKQSRITPPPAQAIQDVSSQVYDVPLNDSLLFKLDGEKPLLLLLKGSNSVEPYQKKAGLPTSSPPTCACHFPRGSGSVGTALVGTAEGAVHYVRVSSSQVTSLWTIREGSQGRVNCLVEVKSGFMVFREGAVELWNPNRECLGRESLGEKVYSGVYLWDEESVLFGSTGGQVTEMFDYEKMMKLARDRALYADKAKLIKEIERLRELRSDLQLKLQKGGLKQEGRARRVQVTPALTLDYNRLCYCLELSSDCPIVRVDLRGAVALLEPPASVSFQSQQQDGSWVYSVRTEDRGSVSLRFRHEEKAHADDRLQCTVYTAGEGGMLCSGVGLQLRSLSLHQKVASELLSVSRRQAGMSTLVVSGEFRHFLMGAWLGGVFSDFGQPSLEGDYVCMCYESLVTRHKVYLAYRDGEAIFHSEAPAPLAVLKSAILRKAQLKQLSLNYDVATDLEALALLLRRLAPRVQALQETVRRHRLLPALEEMPREGLSPELQQLIVEGPATRRQHEQQAREHEEMQGAVRELLVAYRGLNELGVSELQRAEMEQALARFDPDRLVRLMQL